MDWAVYYSTTTVLVVSPIFRVAPVSQALPGIPYIFSHLLLSVSQWVSVVSLFTDL